MDVLSAENDYFQSATQLIHMTVEETLSAYHLLSLTGNFEIPHGAGLKEYPEELKRLGLSTSTFDMLPIQEGRTESLVAEKIPPQPAHTDVVDLKRELPTSDLKEKSLKLVIGPCIGKHEIDQAKKVLSAYNIPYSQTKEPGKIRVTRLLEGMYPAVKARQKLAKISNDFPYAYVLPEESGQLGLYLGAFHQIERAQSYANQTQEMGVMTEQITVEIEATGQMFKAEDISKAVSEKVLRDMSKTRIIASVFQKR